MTAQGRGLWALAFFACVAFLPGVIDPAMSIRWAVLAVGVPVVLMLGDRTPARVMALMCVIMGVFIIGLVYTPGLLDGAEEVIHMAILAGAVCLGAAVKDLTPAWRGMAAGMWVSAALGIAQLSGFTGIEQHISPAGLFMNKNMLAEAGMLTFVASYAASPILSLGPLACAIMGGSKAVYLALGVVFVVWGWRRNRFLAAMLASNLAAACLVWAFLGNHESLTDRFTLWTYVLGNLAWAGHGTGSFTAAIPRIEYAHSEYLHLIFEHGLLALPLLAAAAYLIRRGRHGAARYVLIAVAVDALFAFPLRLPATGFAAALAAGSLAAGLLVRGGAGWFPVADSVIFRRSRLSGGR